MLNKSITSLGALGRAAAFAMAATAGLGSVFARAFDGPLAGPQGRGSKNLVEKHTHGKRSGSYTRKGPGRYHLQYKNERLAKAWRQGLIK